MRFLCQLLIVLLSTQAQGAFENVQPIDDYTREALVWDNKQVAATISDVMQYSIMLGPLVPLAIEEKWDEVKYGATGLGVTYAVTGLFKFVTSRERPNQQNRKSFFSGHTSGAFAGAAIMCREYEDLCPYALGWAGLVGYLRIAADKHWLSDVAIGAGMGYALGAFTPQIVYEF